MSPSVPVSGSFGLSAGRLGATALGVLVLALVALGCAAPSPEPTPPPSPGTAEAPRVVNVIMRDYLFEPNPIVLYAGETVRFNVVNAGLLPHEFVLGDAAVQAAWASAEAAATPPGFTATPPPVSLPPDQAGFRIWLESGQSASGVYLVPDDPALELVCQIPGHVAKGMVGTVEIIRAQAP
jgi:uncharacterized cupredoxin-like copper-binding protein